MTDSGTGKTYLACALGNAANRKYYSTKYIRCRICWFNAWDPDALRNMLKALGSPAVPKDIGISKNQLRDTLLYSKDTRNRYSVCQLIWDLGLSDTLADRVIGKLESTGGI